MIRFACKCGLAFNVTDDRAGETTQCPRCGLLVDVPSAAELAWMGPDGTLAVDESAAGEPPRPGERLADLVRVYGRSRFDEFGREIDLRPTDAHFDRVGNHPSGAAHRPERIAPRYDPVTGERIVPLSLKDEDPLEVIPMAELVEEDDEPVAVVPLPVEAVPVVSMESVRVRKPAKVARPPRVPPPPVEVVLPVPVIPVQPSRKGRQLGYATGERAHQTTLSSLAVDLLVWPANTVVLCFVFAFYWLAFLLKIPLNGFAIIFNAPPVVFALFNLPMWALVAHYGCVVEDVGPDAIDELPRPLRNFSPADDLFGPAIKVAVAAALCFGAAFVAGAVTGMDTPRGRAVTLALAAAGCYPFPAVVLTLLTGTTVLNLTPLRVAGVIRACGGQYLLSVVLAGAVLVGSAGFLLGPSVLTPLGNFRFLRYGTNLAVLVPVMFATMYVTHYFAWHLGLMYRANHDAFPWQAQRHVPTPRGRRPTAAS